jgi:hypothetical protein
MRCCCMLTPTFEAHFFTPHGSELACWLELGGVSVPQLVLYVLGTVISSAGGCGSRN